MINLKGCPRCSVGDLFEGSDEYGRYRVCIQCGYMGYGEKRISPELAASEVSKRRSRRTIH
jgi:uncharacterized protein (DUF983 family)